MRSAITSAMGGLLADGYAQDFGALPLIHVVPPPPPPPPTTIAGTTLAALQSGSANLKWVIAIEGYSWLLTDALPSSAVAAWSGTDWTQALDGLFVNLDNSQAIDPWNIFQPGPTCTFNVQADPTDQFGIDVHKRSSGAETYLTVTADRAATQINVKSTMNFAAAPAQAFIGTECLTYDSMNATQLLCSSAALRGRYSPFGMGDGPGPFAPLSGHHRVGFDPNTVILNPIVSQEPRTWIGKWVAVHLHTTDGTLLNAKSDSLRLFAGKIADIRDDAETGHTIVELKHVLDCVSDATVGRDMWSATVVSGYWVNSPQTITFGESNTQTSFSANPLLCVASGASGTNQFNEGYYTPTQLASIINTWLEGELLATRITGTYTMVCPENLGNGGQPATVMHWIIPQGTGGTGDGGWRITFPNINVTVEWSTIFGFIVGQNYFFDENTIALEHFIASPLQPGSGDLFDASSSGYGAQAKIQQASGTFVDQFDRLPAGLQALIAANGGNTGGVFLFNDNTLLVGEFDGANTLSNMFVVDPSLLGGELFPTLGEQETSTLDQYFGISSDLIAIKQVYLLVETFSSLMRLFYYNTGTPDWNSLSYDDAGYGLGMGIPGELLYNTFGPSIDQLPGAENGLACLIDETTKFSDLMSGDLILRRAFPIWKNGTLRYSTWITPTNDQAIATLSEDNKSETVTATTSQRTSTTETTEWLCDVIKIDYNRSITNGTSSDDYATSFTFEDAVDVDDSGGEGTPKTIQARNTYGELANTGAGLEALAPGFLATTPLFSRPMRMITRSLDVSLYETIAPGDVVSVIDTFSRDPATGMRGTFDRPGLVTRTRYNLGGPTPGSNSYEVTPAAGECDVYFLDVNRISSYVPCAQLDDTANSSGFTSGYDSTTHVLRCYAAQHSIPATEVPDAQNFSPNDVVVIVEIDPANPASPLEWSRTVLSVSNNDIALTAALASPAFDTTKKYRVIFDHYTADQSSQKVKAFQALSTSGMIESLSPPAQYGSGGDAGGYAGNGTNDLAELHSTLSYGDGKARDVGFERGIVRTLNRLADTKTAHQSPMLSSKVVSNTTYSGSPGWQILMVTPIFLTLEGLSAQVFRYLWVQPWIRSATGAAVQFRASILNYLIDTSSVNDALGTPAYAVVWSTTSTTWGVGARDAMFVSAKDPTTGIAWLYLEGTIHGETRGFSHIEEGTRNNT